LQYSSSIEALKYLQENQENILELPKMIFMDIYMSEMSGFEFMKECDKLSTSLKNLCRVFIISSSIDEQDLSCANNDKNIVAIKENLLPKSSLPILSCNCMRLSLKSSILVLLGLILK